MSPASSARQLPATRIAAENPVSRYRGLRPNIKRDFKGGIARIETWLELLSGDQAL
ncbi:hypothetical protein [Streptacidiphilus cavernicola]|uniref:Uncharacterized protein n=1 Tax=Streptacidiphilus cavernicola TaxID=3342716 RepID=A0ABV6VNQ5_9ACTN